MSILYFFIVCSTSLSILLHAAKPESDRSNTPSFPVLGLGELLTGKILYSSSGNVARNFFVQDAIPPLPVRGNKPSMLTIFMTYKFPNNLLHYSLLSIFRMSVLPCLSFAFVVLSSVDRTISAFYSMIRPLNFQKACR